MPVGRLREPFAAKALKSASADPPPGAGRRWPLQAPMRGASGRPSERAPSRTPPRLPAELPAEPEPSRAAPPADPPRLAAVRASMHRIWRTAHRSRPAAAIYAHTSSWRAADLASSEGNGVGVRAISPSELPAAAAGKHAALSSQLPPSSQAALSCTLDPAPSEFRPPAAIPPWPSGCRRPGRMEKPVPKRFLARSFSNVCELALGN